MQPIFRFFVLNIILISGGRVGFSEISTPAQETPLSERVSSDSHSTPEVLPEIKAFLDRERPNLSKHFPYRINLLVDGKLDENKSGRRFSETIHDFEGVKLGGLTFFYQLYNHAMRVPHWHPNATEVGVVLSGKMKITIWDGERAPQIFTVGKNSTWFIPQGTLHALENVGEENLDFLVTYDSPLAQDRDFSTALSALPDTLLERSLGLTSDDIATLKKSTINRLSSYDPEAVLQESNQYSPLSSCFLTVEPLYSSELGCIRRIDSKINPEMKAMVLQYTLLQPGTMREPHWYIGGDAMFFVHQGKAFFTMMDHEGKVYHALLDKGDLVSLPVGTFHTFVNVTTEPLEVYEVFNVRDSEGISEVTLLSGAKHFRPGTLAGATGLSKEVITEKLLNKPPQKYITAF